MATENRLRKIAVNAVKVVTTVLIIAVLVRKLGWGTIVGTVSGADPLWLAAGLAVFLVSGGLGVVQWQLLLRNRGLALSGVRAFKLYFVGMFFNNFIMGGIVGDAVKVASIRSRDGSGKAGFAATFLDRFAGLWAMCGFAVAGSVILLKRGMISHGRVETAVAALFAAFAVFAGIMLFLTIKPLQSLFFSIVDKLSIARKFKVKEIVSEMLIEAQDIKLLAAVAALSAVTQFLRIGVHILTAASLGLLTVDNFQYFFIFVPIIAMIMTVPLPFGVREAAGGALFALAGFPKEAAFIMGFLASLIGITASVLGGVFFVTERMRKSS
ncbi:hypothetical protein R80B4_01480 [Fibrobacteres bacterium R8-0-B4]